LEKKKGDARQREQRDKTEDAKGFFYSS
jgi:hypothetical protein